MNLLNVLETDHLGLDGGGVIWLDRLDGYDHEEWDFPRAIGLVGGPMMWPEDLQKPEWLSDELWELQDDYEEASGLNRMGEAIAAYTRALGEPGRWACMAN